MKILVIGAHGRVGQRIVNQLNDNGDDVLAGLRDEKQFNTFTGAHITPTLLDIQQITVADLTQLMTGADAVVFSAGAGGGGYDRTMLIDLDGAVKAMQATEQAGIKRFIMVSAMGTGSRATWADAIRPYYAAKFYADHWLINDTNLAYTILRPSTLSDEAGTGKITVNAQDKLEDGAKTVSRDDVAKVAVVALHDDKTIKQIISFTGGDTAIETAVDSLG